MDEVIERYAYKDWERRGGKGRRKAGGRRRRVRDGWTKSADVTESAGVCV